MVCLKGQAQDTARLAELEHRCRANENNNPDSVILYGEEGLALAKALDKPKKVFMFYTGLGKAYVAKGDNDKGADVFRQAYAFALQEKDKKDIEKAQLCLAYVAQQRSDIPTALDYTLQAVRIAGEIRDTGYQEVGYSNIAVLFYKQENFPKAIEYAQKSLQVGANVKGSDHILATAKTYELLGAVYYRQSNLPDARTSYEKALKIYQDNHIVMGIATMYTQLANVTPKDYTATLDYAFKAKAIWDSLGPDNYYAIVNLGNIGIAYADMGRDDSSRLRPGGELPTTLERAALLRKGEDYLIRAVLLAKQAHNTDNELQFMDTLASVQAVEGKGMEAFRSLKERNVLYDSVYSQANKNKIASMDEKYQVELRDAQIETKNQALKAQTRQRWFLIGGLVLLAIIGVLLYLQSRLRKRNNASLQRLNTQLDEANQVKTRFFNILNHDLRAPVGNLINYLRLQREDPDFADAATRAAHTRRLETNAENLMVTMEDLLTWSKGQMTNFKPRIAPVPVSDLFAGLETYFSGLTNVALTFDAPASMRVSTDEHYLKTVMRNLTNNAVKALGGAPGAAIAWKAWEDNGKAYLSITDNGPGATDQQLKGLYDDSAPIGLKSGLGLHVVRDMAQAIGCTISVQTAPGRGTSFTLAL